MENWEEKAQNTFNISKKKRQRILNMLGTQFITEESVKITSAKP